MLRQSVLILALGVFSSAEAAMIDLKSKGLALSESPLASSENMLIVDIAPFAFNNTVVPGIFQAIDSSGPLIELSSGDGVIFSLLLFPLYMDSVTSSEVAVSGESELEILFLGNGSEGLFVEFELSEGDKVSSILTGSPFGAASINVWTVQAVAPVPLPLGFFLIVTSFWTFRFFGQAPQLLSFDTLRLRLKKE